MAVISTLINEEVEAQALLKSYLEDDATLMGMVNGIALRTRSARQLRSPFVKIDRQDASDLTTFNMHRVWSELSYLVRGVTTYADDPEWETVKAIANRIENLLAAATISGSAATVYCVRRLEPFTDETLESDNLYFHAGGIYEMYAQAV